MAEPKQDPAPVNATSETKKNNDDADVKKISFTPFVTDLLSPSAKYLGEELKTFIKTKIEEKKKQVRSENLKLHLEAIEATGTENKKPLNFNDVEDLEFFDAWADGAQDAAPSHPDLFEIWQSILHGVMDQKIFDRYIIEKAKQLSSEDARLLKNIRWFGVRALNRDRHATLQRLETLGFLTRNNLALWIPSFIFSLPLLVFAANGIVSGDESLGLLLLSGGMGVLLLWGQIAFGYLIFFVLLAAYPLWNGGSVSSWHLSPMGRILISLGDPKLEKSGRQYIVLHHAVLGYAAVKLGMSFPGLFLGPLWVVTKRLWKVSAYQIAFVLIYMFVFSEANIKALPLSIGYVIALSEKISAPLLFLVLFVLPAIKGNDWVVKQLSKNGYDYLATTNAKTKMAAIALVEKHRTYVAGA